MTIIVYHQHSGLHIIQKLFSQRRIILTGRGNLLLVRVEIKFADKQFGIQQCGTITNGIRATNMLISIAVISKINSLILPIIQIIITDISYNLIHNTLCLRRIINGDTTDSDIHLIGNQISSTIIIQQCEIIVGSI